MGVTANFKKEAAIAADYTLKIAAHAVIKTDAFGNAVWADGGRRGTTSITDWFGEQVADLPPNSPLTLVSKTGRILFTKWLPCFKASFYPDDGGRPIWLGSFAETDPSGWVLLGGGKPFWIHVLTRDRSAADLSETLYQE